MITPLQYQQIPLLEQLIRTGMQRIEDYEQASLDLHGKTDAWLDETIDFFRQFNGIGNESQMKVLKGDHAMIQAGSDPAGQGHIALTRRSHRRQATYKVIKQGIEVLNNHYEAIDSKLKQAGNLIEQIVLAALQANLLSNDDLNLPGEQLWSKMRADNNLQLMQKKILLSVSKFDALLLLSDITAAIK